MRNQEKEGKKIFDREDEICLDDFLKGSHEMIEVVYREYFPSIKQYILSNSGRIEDAEDVFQEALLIVFKKGTYEKLRITCSLSTYLYSVARNIWMQKLRFRKVNAKFISASQVEESSYSEEDDKYLEEARLNLFREHFLGLKPDCQKLLKLALQDKSLDEIGLAMGYKGSSYAKTKKFNCKEMLMKRIKKDPRYKNLFK